MTITYRVTRRDVARASRTMHLRYPRQRLFMLGYLLLFLLPPPHDGSLSGFIVKLITSILLVLGILWIITTIMSLLPGKGRGLICEHTFTALPDEWIEKTEFNETHGKWGSITGVIETKQLLLIIIDHTNSHVIPRTTIDADAYRSFLKAVRENVPKEAFIRPVQATS